MPTNSSTITSSLASDWRDDVRDLLGLVARVDGDDHRADRVRAQPQQDPLDVVRAPRPRRGRRAARPRPAAPARRGATSARVSRPLSRRSPNTSASRSPCAAAVRSSCCGERDRLPRVAVAGLSSHDHAQYPFPATQPPSTHSTCPLTYSAPGPHRKTAAPCRSRRLTPAPERHVVADQLRERLVLEVGRGQRGLDHARADGVDADPVLARARTPSPSSSRSMPALVVE